MGSIAAQIGSGGGGSGTGVDVYPTEVPSSFFLSTAITTVQTILDIPAGAGVIDEFSLHKIYDTSTAIYNPRVKITIDGVVILNNLTGTGLDHMAVAVMLLSNQEYLTSIKIEVQKYSADSSYNFRTQLVRRY